MIVLFDTCVILDYLLDRGEFADDAEKLILKVIYRKLIGMITVKSFMDIHYVLKHSIHDEKKTRNAMLTLLDTFMLMDSFADDAVKALLSDVNDCEDALMVSAAMTMETDCIVTRNKKDYKHSGVQIFTPKELLAVCD